ncbi:MAG: hypothetical protein LPK80_11680 [Bacteroidota bacterium]|nr:hypothetical protein [Bacteroidota bacterium]
MEKRRKGIQVYAILIATVAVIAFLISAANFISAWIDLDDPLYAGRSEDKYASFENFKMDVLRSVSKEQTYVPDEKALLTMYEAAKEEKIRSATHQSRRNMMVSGWIGGISLILFLSHFWILRRSDKEDQSGLK